MACVFDVHDDMMCGIFTTPNGKTHHSRLPSTQLSRGVGYAGKPKLRHAGTFRPRGLGFVCWSDLTSQGGTLQHFAVLFRRRFRECMGKKTLPVCVCTLGGQVWRLCLFLTLSSSHLDIDWPIFVEVIHVLAINQFSSVTNTGTG